MATPAEQQFPLEDHARALALWAFIHPRAQRFRLAEALELDQRLSASARRALDEVASTLQEELRRYRITLKHCQVLEAASRYIGYRSLSEANAEGARNRL